MFACITHRALTNVFAFCFSGIDRRSFIVDRNVMWWLMLECLVRSERPPALAKHLASEPCMAFTFLPLNLALVCCMRCTAAGTDSGGKGRPQHSGHRFSLRKIMGRGVGVHNKSTAPDDLRARGIGGRGQTPRSRSAILGRVPHSGMRRMRGRRKQTTIA